VDDYRRQFEQLFYHITLFDNSLSTTMLTAQFLLGLNSEIRSAVEMLLPVLVAKAATLTLVQEQMLEKSKKPVNRGVVQ
jgi:hypothetical protein